MAHDRQGADPLVVDEDTSLGPSALLREGRARGGQGVRAWREQRAFAVHRALMDVKAAAHQVDVHLGALLRRMIAVRGYRRWGHAGVESYLVEELRQTSVRRFRYLVAIDGAIAERPLVKLGDAWRRGTVTVSRARELIRVMTPDNEEEWLRRASSMSVWRLKREVARALALHGEGGAAAGEGGEQCAQGIPPGGEAPQAAGPVEAGEERWSRRGFAATRPVDSAWQAAVETARRMAGFDLQVHDCVDDLLAEYMSGCRLPAGVPVRPVPERPVGLEVELEVGPEAREDAAAPWRQAQRRVDEAWEELRRLRDMGRTARLALDPLEGLGGRGGPDAADPADLHARIRWLLRVEQNIAWHECRLMGSMAALRFYARLGLPSLRAYAVEVMGVGGRTPFMLAALARGFQRLPRVEEAFRLGRITALEATEIMKVATGRTQSAWIARARSSTLAQLREEVAFVLAVDEPSGLPPERPLPGLGEGQRPCSAPAAGRTWATSGSAGGGPPGPARRGGAAGGAEGRAEGGCGEDDREVQTCAPETSGALATTVAYRTETWYSAFASDRPALFAALLSRKGPKRPVGFTAPEATARHWDLTLADCRAGWRLEEDGGVLSDTQCIALLVLNFMQVWAHPKVVRGSRAHRIFTRDGWRCQVPYCRSRANLNAHHMVFRSKGGCDKAWNLITVCRRHHEMIHAGIIRVAGRAPGSVRWLMGIGAGGAVREEYQSGTRVGCDPHWRPPGADKTVISPTDWRQACDATA
ncbi:MAG TPA: HNH endonuclease signature motif containing protein [Candidatus Polarisedimenticolia bacterium]|nr:HNH endonuclease signature motif containing protein [Candidatus Polarisedimenticolia bacterium]